MYFGRKLRGLGELQNKDGTALTDKNESLNGIFKKPSL
jgi:hypothetical protein|tara:strand:+ start:602 stop:715 length:114 start_codon:yes stop_codon:yes gene_type:complete